MCLSWKAELQSNSVKTNSMGPQESVRYSREIVITVKIYVVNMSFGTKKWDKIRS